MRKRWNTRSRPSISLGVALVALFVALGGGATAAQKVLFTGKDIKDRSISGRDIRASSIGPKHLNRKARSLLRSVAPVETRTAVTGEAGPKGDPGPRGPKGDPGNNGARGPRGLGCYEKNGDKKRLAGTPVAKKSLAPCRGPRGRRGAAGPAGPAGLEGAVGPRGAAGADGVEGADGVGGAGLSCANQLALSAAVPAFVTDSSCTIVINEILYDNAGTDVNEFVELFGTPGSPLAGWTLAGVNGATCSDYKTLDLTGATIPADGHLLIAGTDATYTDIDFVDPAAPAIGIWQNGPDAVELRNADGAVVDAVAYGTSTCGFGEGSSAPGVPGDSSLTRDATHTDTDDNASDFTASATPSPGS